MTEERRKILRYIIWVNLFVGLYNIYLYVNGGDWWFNLLIGSLNIGVWVFNRKILNKWEIKSENTTHSIIGCFFR